MPRPMLFHRRSITGRFSRHLASRGVLRARMQATTPVAFLRRLNLLQDDHDFGPAWWQSFEFGDDSSTVDLEAASTPDLTDDDVVQLRSTKLAPAEPTTTAPFDVESQGARM